MNSIPENFEALTTELTKQLVSVPSVSPDSSSAQSVLKARLQGLGFSIEEMPLFGANNFWAQLGESAPLFVFSGHTDVVSPGSEAKWKSQPFTPVVRDGKLFGRGTADMKGAIAAMITAVESFLADNSQKPPFSIGFLITGDEELGGPSANEILNELTKKVQIDYCLVGEPSSETRFGDTIKLGRRGSLSANITFHGQQGHVGYPHLADNALHRSFEPLLALSRQVWSDDGEYFQPTTFQITSVTGGIASNVIPGEAVASCNFRYSYYNSAASLKTGVEQILSQIPGLSYSVEWTFQSDPFLTKPGTLTSIVLQSIAETIGENAGLSTAGGTSDARFFAKHGIQVVELGPINRSIHQIDEHVAVADLGRLAQVYKSILNSIAETSKLKS